MILKVLMVLAAVWISYLLRRVKKLNKSLAEERRIRNEEMDDYQKIKRSAADLETELARLARWALQHDSEGLRRSFKKEVNAGRLPEGKKEELTRRVKTLTYN
jgi:Tfp pilus assembly protein PilO